MNDASGEDDAVIAARTAPPEDTLPATVLLQARTPSPGVATSRGPRVRTPQRPHEAYARVSPYPLRVRTPPQVDLPPHQRARSRTPTSHGSGAVQTETASPLDSDQLQLIVKPIIKSSIGQRESSGDTLNNFLVEGTTFQDILRKLWEKFNHRIKQRAIKQDGVWSYETPTMSEWTKLMQFKYNNHIVDSEKTERAWNLWMTARRGKTVKLLIYEFGLSITKGSDLDEFLAACIRPAETDRAGATAECSLRDVVSQLQEHWESSFSAEAVVWRMWGNHITRNLDRSTWIDAISTPPPDYITHLLRATDSQAQRRLSSMSRSAEMALECVNASLADNQQIRQDVEALGRRLAAQESALSSRKLIIEAFLHDIAPPPACDVIDPLSTLENIEDVEHQE